ncbi:MAG: hypothetical protein K2N78_07250 [Oscillospiraceae bacterium]|nr:hypothetical protein [Oscillospiraceae bacterium]
MDELMQVLYDHLTANILERYYCKTAFAERARARDEIGRKLWEQLDGERRDLLEQLQRAYDYTQLAELEAMFLAAFDESNAIRRQHIA